MYRIMDKDILIARPETLKGCSIYYKPGRVVLNETYTITEFKTIGLKEIEKGIITLKDVTNILNSNHIKQSDKVENYTKLSII